MYPLFLYKPPQEETGIRQRKCWFIHAFSSSEELQWCGHQREWAAGSFRPPVTVLSEHYRYAGQSPFCVMKEHLVEDENLPPGLQSSAAVAYLPCRFLPSYPYDQIELCTGPSLKNSERKIRRSWTPDSDQKRCLKLSFISKENTPPLICHQ